MAAQGAVGGGAHLPELVIEGTRSPTTRAALAELWLHRGLVLAFAIRDVKVKYKQAILGVAWAVVQPLGLLVLFTLLVARAVTIRETDVPYPAFALSALIPWLFLQNAVVAGTGALLADSAVVRTISFPREAPILGAVMATAIEFWIGVGLYLALAPFVGARLGPTAILVVPLFVLCALLAAGVSVALGALNVYYRDVRYVLPFAVQLWMFASPVVYPLSTVPPRWQVLYVTLNPAAGLLDAFGRSLASGMPPEPMLLGLSTVTTVAVGWIGYRLFKWLEPAFADVI